MVLSRYRDKTNNAAERAVRHAVLMRKIQGGTQSDRGSRWIERIQSVDHIADKVAATFDRYGAAEAPSTRYKDLVDLVAIVTESSVESQAQTAALASEARRRRITLPQRFSVPDRSLWERGYAAEAGRSLLPVARTLDEALAVVRPFLDPLLDGTAVGRWDPKPRSWVS